MVKETQNGAKEGSKQTNRIAVRKQNNKDKSNST